jgi:hypothetical protein
MSQHHRLLSFGHFRLILPVISLVKGLSHWIAVGSQAIVVSGIDRVGHRRGWVWHCNADIRHHRWVCHWQWALATVEGVSSRPIVRVRRSGTIRGMGGRRANECGGGRRRWCTSKGHCSSTACPYALAGWTRATTTGTTWHCLFLLCLGLLQFFQPCPKILQWELSFEFVILDTLYNSPKRRLLLLICIDLQEKLY